MTRPTNYRLSPFVQNTLYPLAERIFEAAFVACLPVGIGAVLAAAMFAWWGIYGLALLALVIAVIAAVGAHSRFVVPYQLKITRLLAEGLPVRVLYFSDLHVNARKNERWVSRVVDEINALQPDVILFGGDFYGHPGKLELARLLAPLAALRAPLGVFAIHGNHDRGMHDYDRPGRPAELDALVPQLGLRWLRNECVPLCQGGLRLIGLGELWAEEDDADAAFAQCPAEGAFTLVLGHNPDLMGKIQHKADLFLFGHTHHGQIFLPFAPGLGLPVKGRLWRGEYVLPQGRVYVSAGIGEAAMAARFNTRPELVLITSPAHPL